MEASLENATLDESEVGASWEVIEGDAVHSETEDGLNESMDGSTANASHSQSNLSSHSKSKEPKMCVARSVLADHSQQATGNGTVDGQLKRTFWWAVSGLTGRDCEEDDKQRQRYGRRAPYSGYFC
ncbi:hypothetical protein OUZ56_026368 [Daphnia magna]|uniref:Uncharacterized protein n=1 Tax=Daphnia magna TaxID=35525 RepID=A0ABQ9ZLK0_9CRUS|nr:hypothetical protein OUZ56_026368 [Daphnia magna]